MKKDNTIKHRQILLSIVFIVSLLPMLLNQYGGMKGVQEITGLINLLNPIGLISVSIYFAGVWLSFSGKHINKLLCESGTMGIVLSEIYKFFTWHVLTITGEISFKNAVRFSFPEFYFGLTVSVLMIFVYNIIDKKIN